MHVKKTLPPTLSGFPDVAEVFYFVKATVQRAAFYKENYRSVCGLTVFLADSRLIWWIDSRI